jgi:prepilin-type N-terminal cleavage/methylation domain-containing protein
MIWRTCRKERGMKAFWNQHKGVTMIEVLVTVAILAIVITPCLSAFVLAQKGNVKAKETYDTYTAAANLMEELKGSEEKRTIVFKPENSNGWYDEINDIIVFFEYNDKYYGVDIYAGHPEQKPTDEQPIVKGVIVP